MDDDESSLSPKIFSLYFFTAYNKKVYIFLVNISYLRSDKHLSQ